MDRYIAGILFFICAAVVYLFAFKQFYHHHKSVAVVLLIIGGAILRVYCSTDWFLHEWDERYHALVAKNLSTNFLHPVLYKHALLPYNPANWTNNHVWLHKQPISLWLMAISIKIFGANELAVRLPSILASLIAIKLVYDITVYMFNTHIAFIAAFLMSINGLVTDLAAGRVATDHIDVLFMFFILLTIYLLVKYIQHDKKIVLLTAGLTLGCAILTKWLPALICIPIYLSMAWYSSNGNLKKLTADVLWLVIMSAMLVLPWHIYINHAYPVEATIEYNMMHKHLNDIVENHQHSVFYHFDMLRIIYGELVYLPIAIFTLHVFTARKQSKHLAIAVWFWAVYIFFSIAATKMQAYTVLAAPAIFIMTAYGFVHLTEYAQTVRYKYIVLAVAILLLALPVRYTIERVSFFAPKEREPQWAKNIKAMSYPDNTILFNSSHPIETMFYHNYTAYQQTPDSNTLHSLRVQGYNLVVLP